MLPYNNRLRVQKHRSILRNSIKSCPQILPNYELKVFQKLIRCNIKNKEYLEFHEKT